MSATTYRAFGAYGAGVKEPEKAVFHGSLVVADAPASRLDVSLRVRLRSVLSAVVAAREELAIGELYVASTILANAEADLAGLIEGAER